MNFDRHRASIPIGLRWRILVDEVGGRFVPRAVLSHEAYNKRKQHPHLGATAADRHLGLRNLGRWPDVGRAGRALLQHAPGAKGRWREACQESWQHRRFPYR